MSEVVKLVLAVALGLTLAAIARWLNTPWWVVVPLALGLIAVGIYLTQRKSADKHRDAVG